MITFKKIRQKCIPSENEKSLAKQPSPLAVGLCWPRGVEGLPVESHLRHFLAKVLMGKKKSKISCNSLSIKPTRQVVNECRALLHPILKQRIRLFVLRDGCCKSCVADGRTETSGFIIISITAFKSFDKSVKTKVYKT